MCLLYVILVIIKCVGYAPCATTEVVEVGGGGGGGGGRRGVTVLSSECE